MNNKTNNNIRYGFIDFLKFFTIFCVVFAHFLPSGSFIRIGIYSFHMPIFFMLSGFTYKENRSFIQIIQKINKRIIIPYVIFFCISFALSIDNDVSNLSQFFDIFYIKGSINSFNSVLWFFPCFILVSILFFTFNKILKNKTWLIIPINIILTILMFYNHSIYIFGFNKIMLMLVYYWIGYYMKKVYVQINVSKKVSFISFIIYLILFFAYSYINNGNSISINQNDINNSIVFLFFSIFECIFLIISAYQIYSYKFIRFIADNTLFIMSTHLFFRILAQSFIVNAYVFMLVGIVAFGIEVIFLNILKSIKSKKIKNLLQYVGIII